ncbi:MAG: hypothetical protein AAF974_04190 [Cyanobacteria bacterium P01_E01_bin.34]
MDLPALGTLVEVNLREAWEHEAHSFTPWMSAHLERLSDAIGIPLELEGREVPVGPFSADILARNPMDDSLVLIENQLEETDHSHLGQIMTYLAGLEAQTIVWVASDFCEPHLSALQWLNDHTVTPFAFFAVKVKAVRIGNSPIAPVFEVMSRPNQWERQLKERAKGARPMSELGLFRKQFWTHYVERFPDERQYGAASGTSSRWRMIDGIPLKIVLFISNGRVGVFVRGDRGVSGEEVFEIVNPQMETLTQSFGAEFGAVGSNQFFKTACLQDTSVSDKWDELSDWLHNTANQYELILTEFFSEKGLNS